VTEVINDIVNNRTEADAFDEMIVVPIYKANKKLPTSNINAFRSISLGECMFKLAEACFIEKNRVKIEEMMGGYQYAYKRGKGTKVAIEKLHEIFKNRRGNFLCVGIDLASAFDSPKRPKI